MARLPAAMLLLLLAAPASGEYMAGFSLYRHTEKADRVLLVEAPVGRHARVVRAIKGRAPLGGFVRLDAGLLRFQEPGSTRAVVFLRRGWPVLSEAGIAWVFPRSVFILPDNWGWGIAYYHREPTPEEFLRALRTADRDRAEVARIAAMPRGARKAVAASDLLERPRPEVEWYVFHGWALHAQFDLDWDTPVPQRGTYLSELRLALAPALGELGFDEAGILLKRIGELPPGEARREHMELVMASKHARTAFDLFRACHDGAADLEEASTAARAMLLADPRRDEALLAALATLDDPERAWRILEALRGRDDAPSEVSVETSARLARDLARAGAGEANLGHLVCRLLKEGGRDEHRALLLEVARS